jgi:hypothetical protein
MAKVQGDKREEVIELATALVKNDFAGDWKACFDAYADGGGRLTWAGVTKFLSDAGASPKWTLPLQVRGVFRELDKNGNGFIEESEFFTSFNTSGEKPQ